MAVRPWRLLSGLCARASEMFLTRMPPSTQPDQRLAATIRRLREDREETQEALAFGAGLTLSGYGRIERGEANPVWTTVKEIASALGLTVGELVAEAETESLMD